MKASKLIAILLFVFSVLAIAVVTTMTYDSTYSGTTTTSTYLGPSVIADFQILSSSNKIEVPYEEHGALWSLQSSGSFYEEALTTPLIYGPNPLNDPVRCCTFRSMKDAMRTIYRFQNYSYEWKDSSAIPSKVPLPEANPSESVPNVKADELASLAGAFKRYRELSVDDTESMVVPVYVTGCVGAADCWDIPKHFTMFGHPKVALGYFIFVVNSNYKEHVELAMRLHSLFPQQFLYLTRKWYRKPIEYEFGFEGAADSKQPVQVALPSGRSIEVPEINLHPFKTIPDDHRNPRAGQTVYPRMGFSQTFNMALNMIYGRHVLYPPPFVMMGNADYYFSHQGIEMFLKCLYGKLEKAVKDEKHSDEGPMTKFWDVERRRALGLEYDEVETATEEYFEGENMTLRNILKIPVAAPIQVGQRINLDTEEMKVIRRDRYRRVHTSQGLPPRSTENPIDFPTVVQFETYSMVGFTYYAWKTFGMFHENRYPAYGEDTDMRKNSVSQGFTINNICYDEKKFPHGHARSLRRHGESQSLRTPGLGQMVDRYRRAHQTIDRWHLVDDINRHDTSYSNAWDMQQPDASEIYRSFFLQKTNKTSYEQIVLSDLAVGPVSEDPLVLCALLQAIQSQATGETSPRWGRNGFPDGSAACDVGLAKKVAMRLATALSQVPLSRNSHAIDLGERLCLMKGRGPKDPDNRGHCAFDRRIALSFLRPVFHP